MGEVLGKVLIVDDDALICKLLVDKLRESGYEAYSAGDAQKAMVILLKENIDLCISDINMPGIKGFELIDRIKKEFPKTKTALITAYDVNDYIKMAKEYGVSNIVSKSHPFNFDEFLSVVKALVTENIFGLDNYMLSDFTVMGEFTIIDSKFISAVEDGIINLISSFHKVEPFVNILLEELITNAIYHAPVDEFGNEKYVKHSDIILDKLEAVKVSVGKDSEKYGVSVMDPSGKLTKEQVLFRFDRHLNGEGLLDESGRGLHMSRIYSDRLILNIRKNVATEAIFINYLNPKYKGSKPLFINEI